MTEPGEVTRLLQAFSGGDSTAMDELLPLVYDELRALAHARRRGWRDAEGTTALVNEAYLRLVRQDGVEWDGRAQFFAIASRAMRSVLVDQARQARRKKRGGGERPRSLEDSDAVDNAHLDELLALDGALERLAADNERAVRIVECRVFGGLSVEETANALSISPATVKRGWSFGRAMLFDELGIESWNGA